VEVFLQHKTVIVVSKKVYDMGVQPMIPTITSEGTSYPLKPQVNHSAFALITIGQGDSRMYLLQWNSKWGSFNLIGGKVDNTKGDENSFSHAMRRELEEEMGLKHPDDYIVQGELKHIYLSQFSQRQQVFKNYHFCVFAVDIFPNLPMDRDRSYSFARWLSTGRQNIFTSKEEVLQLRTYQNRPISRTTRLVLQELGELPAHGC
jgi:8-oxo-dGTP pyrophosphatase MutT (NUDIX family)